MAPKKKKTKKELAEEKRLLEEQLKLEKEAAEAAAAAEAERQRLIEEEKARIRAEEEKKRRIEEESRLKEESSVYDPWYNGRRASCREIREEVRQWSEWQRYLENVTLNERAALPAPDSQKALNTFLSQWEDSVSTDPDEMVDSIQMVGEVVHSMHKQMPEFSEDARMNELTWSKERSRHFMECANTKTLQSTDQMLQVIENYADKDKVVLKTFNRPRLTFSLWSNLNHGAKLPRVLELPHAGITFDMPKLLSRAQFAIRTVQTEFDHIDLEESGDEKRALGGILTFDMYTLPPFSRKAQSWNLRHLPEGFIDTALLNHTNMFAVDDDTGAAKPNAQAQPVKLQFKVPGHVLMRENPTRVAWWDSVGKAWKTEGVESVAFDEETREVQCETMVISPIAVVQSRSLDIPYGRWTLNPTGFNIATLTLELKSHTLVIEIQESFAKLLQPDLPELKDILGVETRPAVLLARLARSGFTVFPTNEDVAHVDTLVPKNTTVEKQLHECMAMNCQGYLYTGSVWNQAAGKDKCVVRLAEKPDVEIEPMLETYKTVIYMFEREYMKCALLECEEHEPAFNEKITTHTHIRLEHTMRPSMPEMCSDNIRNSSIKFQEAVRHTLDALRLFSFA